jgi:hypothetical protein
MAVLDAMSTKILLQAGLLIVDARLELHRIKAVLDPSTPQSIVSRDNAERLGASQATEAEQPITRHKVVGLGADEVKLHAIKIGRTPSGTQMIVGSDLMREEPLYIDFPGARFELFERWKALKYERHMEPVSVTISRDGCLSISGTAKDGSPLRVALKGAMQELPSGISPISFRMGSLLISATYSAACPANNVTVGWDAFAGRRILIDVAAGRLWIDGARNPF